jgi:Family of unknown function (DUF6152)
MNIRYSMQFVGAALALGVAAAPVSAHHGWSGQSKEQFELTGIVENPLSLAGPHATMKIRAEGKVWDITLAPSSRTARAGLTEGVIPVGAQVTVSGHRSLDANRSEIKTERVTYNGKLYNVYPDRS